MNHYTAKSALQKMPPKVSLKTLALESVAMITIAGVLVQIL